MYSICICTDAWCFCPSRDLGAVSPYGLVDCPVLRLPTSSPCQLSALRSQTFLSDDRDLRCSSPAPDQSKAEGGERATCKGLIKHLNESKLLSSNPSVMLSTFSVWRRATEAQLNKSWQIMRMNDSLSSTYSITMHSCLYKMTQVLIWFDFFYDRQWSG